MHIQQFEQRLFVLSLTIIACILMYAIVYSEAQRVWQGGESWPLIHSICHFAFWILQIVTHATRSMREPTGKCPFWTILSLHASLFVSFWECVISPFDILVADPLPLTISLVLLLYVLILFCFCLFATIHCLVPTNPFWYFLFKSCLRFSLIDPIQDRPTEIYSVV